MTVSLFPEQLLREPGYARLSGEGMPGFRILNPDGASAAAGCDLLHLAGSSLASVQMAEQAGEMPIVYSPLMRRRPGVMRFAAMLGMIGAKAGSGIASMRKIACRAARLTAVTQTEADTIARILRVPRENISIVPPSYDPAVLIAPKGEIVRCAGSSLFVTAASFDPGGPAVAGNPTSHRLMEALAKINLPALVFGCGATPPAGMRSGITFVAEDDLLPAAAGAASAFIEVSERPSRMLALTAMSAGAHIVMTQHRGMEEIFGGDAEYVDTTSWELMHHGVTTALNREDAVAEKYNKEYSPQKAAAALAALYAATARR